MSKKNKVLKSTSTEAIAGTGHFDGLVALLAPEPSEEIVELFLGQLEASDVFDVVDRVSAKLEEAAKLTVEADELVDQEGTTQAELIGKILPRIHHLQTAVEDWEKDLKQKAFNKKGLTVARAVWENNFPKMLQAEVDRVIRNDSAASLLARELEDLVEKATQMRKANEVAKARELICRETASLLTKEANELLASIQ